MNKFEVLEQYQYVLVKLKLSSTQKDTNGFFYSIPACYIVCFWTTFWLATAASIYQNEPEFNESLRIVEYVIGGCQAFAMFCCYGFNIRKIQAVHKKLQQSIDKTFGGIENFILKRLKQKIHCYSPAASATRKVRCVLVDFFDNDEQ